MYVYYARETFSLDAENENRHNGGALPRSICFHASRNVSAVQISATESRKMKGTFILAFPVRV